MAADEEGVTLADTFHVTQVTQTWLSRGGGVATTVEGLQGAFRQEGWSTAIFSPDSMKCGRMDAGDPRGVANRATAHLARIARRMLLPVVPGIAELSYAAATGNALTRSLRRSRVVPDVCVVHEPVVDVSGARTVLVVHTVEGRLSQRVAPYHRASERARSSYIAREQRAAARSAQVVAVGARAAESFAERTGYAAISVPPFIPNLREHVGGILPTNPTISTVGRLHKGKGTSLLIDAAIIARNQMPNLRLMIIGDGPERRRLQAQVSRYGAGGWVRFYGHADDPSQLVASSDLYVHPSLSETGPIALMEAVAVGTPVVSFDTGVTREIFGMSPIVEPLGDVQALADRIVTGLCEVRGNGRAALVDPLRASLVRAREEWWESWRDILLRASNDGGGK